MNLTGQVASVWKKSRAGNGPAWGADGDGDEDGFGLHTLVAKDPEAPGMVDIVAVHGLNGHFKRTWTDEKTGNLWLRDDIKLSIPFARVLSFSYNSAVQFSKSTSDIPVFADQLLESLLASRSSYEEQNRPVIFVCHSLGGIVVKQALVRCHESERFGLLDGRMGGVLFFGTPHRGSDAARWATLMGGLLKMSSLASSTNTQIPKDLQPKSALLQGISRSFIERARRLRIYSFYETDKMDFMKDVIVDSASATMGMDREVAIPIEGNHRTMCRCSAGDEARFQPVMANLRSLAKELSIRQEVDIQGDVVTLMMELSMTNWKQHKERNPPPVEGTCTWLLEDPVYRNWLSRVDSFLLWVSADPGCGKSVLASYLINNEMGQESKFRGNICYFFFKSDNHEQRNGATALQSLLRQLLEQQPYLQRTAANILGDTNLEDLDSLWLAFIKSVDAVRATAGDLESSRVRPPVTVCILDGLDECDDLDRKALVRLVSRTFGATTDPPKSKQEGSASRGVLKFLILSRPDNAFRAAFDKPQPHASKSSRGPQAAMIRLRGEDQTDAISADISRVVKATISGLVEQGLPEDLLEDVQAQLIRRADNTFLWVTLIIQLLGEKVETGASRRELQAILESRDIDAIYAELLATRSDAAKARKMLSIVLAAARPLTTAEMSIALAIRPDHDALKSGRAPRRPEPKATFKDLEYDLVFPFETHLKSICGNFVRIIRDKVYLVHETAREFLLEREHFKIDDDTFWSMDDDAHDFGEWDVEPDTTPISRSHTLVAVETATGPWQHSFSLSECEGLLLQICTTFLYLLAKRCDIAERWKPSKNTKPFLAYAAPSWALHFAAVRDRIASRDLRYYENLCHPRFPGFPTWIEAFHNGPDAVMEMSIGRTEDELQDLYTKMLGIEVTSATPTGARAQGRGMRAEDGLVEELTTGGEGGRGRFDKINQLSQMSARYFSSHPSQLSNHYFPVEADEMGFVSFNRLPPKATESPSEERIQPKSAVASNEASKGAAVRRRVVAQRKGTGVRRGLPPRGRRRGSVVDAKARLPALSDDGDGFESGTNSLDLEKLGLEPTEEPPQRI